MFSFQPIQSIVLYEATVLYKISFMDLEFLNNFLGFLSLQSIVTTSFNEIGIKLNDYGAFSIYQYTCRI